MKKLIFIFIMCIGLCGCSKNLDLNSSLVKELYQKATPSEDASILTKLYENSGRFHNSYILATAAKNYLNDNKSIEVISKESMEEHVSKIFGTKTSFTHQDFFLLADNYCGFKYNKDKEEYILINGCDGDYFHKYLRKITKATSNDNIIKIYEKSLYLDTSNNITIYNNVIDKKIIAKNINKKPEEIDIDNYLNNASTYEYTFEKINNEYIFTKFQLIK